MDFLVACKNEEDPIKNEGARVVTTLFINFSDPQGQLAVTRREGGSQGFASYAPYNLSGDETG